jgi:hypothetical protein
MEIRTISLFLLGRASSSRASYAVCEFEVMQDRAEARDQIKQDAPSESSRSGEFVRTEGRQSVGFQAGPLADDEI